MFFRKTDKTPEKTTINPMTNPMSLKRKTTPSIIAADMNVLGNVMSEGLVDVNGRVEGNVRAGQVNIRANGVVTGDVIAEAVQVYGHVKGIIKARHVELFASCKVEGIIMHESLMVEDGAHVDGKFKRTDKVELDDASKLSDSMPFMEEEGSEDDKVTPMSMMDNIRLISG